MVALLTAVSLSALYYPSLQGAGTKLSGRMFISDAGASHGGFEYTASYNVSLVAYGLTGVMMIELDSGLGDAIQKHQYEVTNLSISTYKVSMELNRVSVELVWVTNDTIWEHYFDNTYVASWGGFAPSCDLNGRISPDILPGLAHHYYVELRLWEQFQPGDQSQPGSVCRPPTVS